MIITKLYSTITHQRQPHNLTHLKLKSKTPHINTAVYASKCGLISPFTFKSIICQNGNHLPPSSSNISNIRLTVSLLPYSSYNQPQYNKYPFLLFSFSIPINHTVPMVIQIRLLSKSSFSFFNQTIFLVLYKPNSIT